MSSSLRLFKKGVVDFSSFLGAGGGTYTFFLKDKYVRGGTKKNLFWGVVTFKFDKNIPICFM